MDILKNIKNFTFGAVLEQRKMPKQPLVLPQRQSSQKWFFGFLLDSTILASA
jgi:hypothetical protein